MGMVLIRILIKKLVQNPSLRVVQPVCRGEREVQSGEDVLNPATASAPQAKANATSCWPAARPRRRR